MFYGLYKFAKVWATGRFNNLHLWAFKDDGEAYLGRLLRASKIPYVKDTCICFQRVRAHGKSPGRYLANCETIIAQCRIQSRVAKAAQNQFVIFSHRYNSANFRRVQSRMKHIARYNIPGFYFTDKQPTIKAPRGWTTVYLNFSKHVNGTNTTRPTGKGISRIKFHRHAELEPYRYWIYVARFHNEIAAFAQLLYGLGDAHCRSVLYNSMTGR